MKGPQNSGCVLGICKSGYQTPQMNVHLRWGCLMFIKRTWTFSDLCALLLKDFSSVGISYICNEPKYKYKGKF